jgi:uncharacterized protein (DUF427 family)
MRITPIPAQEGQESVWDYPRPPALVPDERRVVVTLGGLIVVDTQRALRVLETSHPPTWYLPVDDVAAGALRPAEGSSVCEWKGRAAYLDVVGGAGVVAERAAWTYPEPRHPYEALRDHVAIYAGPMDRITVEGEEVLPQPGGFYGGWITPEVVGPFKGAAGTYGW